MLRKSLVITVLLLVAACWIHFRHFAAETPHGDPVVISHISQGKASQKEQRTASSEPDAQVPVQQQIDSSLFYLPPGQQKLMPKMIKAAKLVKRIPGCIEVIDGSTVPGMGKDRNPTFFVTCRTPKTGIGEYANYYVRERFVVPQRDLDMLDHWAPRE